MKKHLEDKGKAYYAEHGTGMEKAVYALDAATAARSAKKKRTASFAFGLIGLLLSIAAFVLTTWLIFLNSGITFEMGLLAKPWLFSMDTLMWNIATYVLPLMFLLVLIDIALFSGSVRRIKTAPTPRRTTAAGLAFVCIALSYASIVELIPTYAGQWWVLIPLFGGMALCLIGMIIEMSISEYGFHYFDK